MASASMDDPENLLAHAAWLRRLAFHLVRDGATADELVQDTWSAALDRPPAADRPVRPWLRRVLTNAARLRWRGERRRAAREQAFGELAETAAPSADELLERHELQQQLARLVAELEEPFRAAILLRYAEAMAPAEIARRLGIPAGTVRSRLAEGLERLRVRLDALHRGDRRAWILALAPLARRDPPRVRPTPVLPALALVAGVAVIAVLLGSVRSPARRVPGATRRDLAAGAAGRLAAIGLDPHGAPPGWVAQAGAPERRVAGRVVSDGAPVAGARVRLTSDLSRTGLVPAVERRTGADGRFDFGIQLARELEIGAVAPGKLAAVAHVDLRDPTVRPAADALELVLGGCLAAFHGTVADASGTPIANAELLREDVIGTQTDAAGGYELCMLPVAASSEQLELVVRARGYGSLAIHAGLSGRERRDFVLTPEAVIDGRVHTPGGAPVGDARIWIEPADAGTRRDTEQTARLIAATDREGRFHIEGLAGGRHRIGGGGRGVTAAPITVAIAAGAAREVELVMSPAAVVRGRVVLGSAPVAGARVAVAGGDAETARSQIDGSFVLDRVPLGEVQLVAPPYRVRSPRGSIPVAGDRDDVTLEVEALGRLSGVVRRHAQPVAAARVCAGRAPDPGAAPSRNTCAVADPAGRYELAGLEPGSYGLFADDAAAGAAVHDVRFSLAAAEQRALDIELVAGGRIAGAVVDPAGVPVAGVHLVFALGSDRDPGRDRSQCVSGGDGRFACAGMAGGSYQVTAYAGPDRSVPLRFGDAPAAVELAGGDDRVDGLRLVVDSTRLAIRGTIVDAAGAPVADARVSAWGRGTEPVWLSPLPGGVSDGDGGFHIAGLAPGGYTLEVRTGDGFRALQPEVTAGSEVRIVVDSAVCKDPRLAPESDPIRRAILPAEPAEIHTRPRQPVIWDHRIQLLGWNFPDRARIGQPFEMALYYRVLAPIEPAWKVFVHFDGAGGRAGRGDHEPLAGRCPTSTWQPGDYIVDRFTTQIAAGDARPARAGMYHIWIGFFTGWPAHWTNLAVSDAASDMYDRSDRVEVATLILE